MNAVPQRRYAAVRGSVLRKEDVDRHQAEDPKPRVVAARRRFDINGLRLPQQRKTPLRLVRRLTSQPRPSTWQGPASRWMADPPTHPLRLPPSRTPRKCGQQRQMDSQFVESPWSNLLGSD